MALSPKPQPIFPRPSGSWVALGIRLAAPLLLALVLVTAGLAAPLPGELDGRVARLSGPSKLSVKKLGKDTLPIATYVTFGSGTWVSASGGVETGSGTYVIRDRQGRKLDLLYDADTLVDLEALIEAWALTLLDPADAGTPVDVTLVDQKVRVAFDRHLDRVKLKARVRFQATHASFDGPVMGKYQLSLSGYGGSQRVLLLGDGDAETQIEDYLVSRGHDVHFAGVYYDWDGLAPDLNDFDVVLFLEGEDYGSDLMPAADAAITNFVAAGGGLVRTEWGCYDIGTGDPDPGVDSLMPVRYAGDYHYGSTWVVGKRNHRLTAGLPTMWDEADAGFSDVNPVKKAKAVIDNADGNPMLTWHKAGGLVVHVNHDMTYSVTDISANVLRILDNAVSFAGGR